MNPAPAIRVHELSYAQLWKPAPEAGFNPGGVRLARRGGWLEIEARLTDPCIRDVPARFNEAVFAKGDVFELFLLAEGDEEYHEIHATPSNALLQLRFRCGHRPPTLDEALVWEPLLESSTGRFEEGWTASLRCDLARFTQQRPTPARWKIACGRYDHREKGPSPVISNTAPLTAPDFHRYWEWPVFDFA